MVRANLRAGMVFVELVCAMAVLGVVSLALSGSGFEHGRAAARALRGEVALRAAEAELEAVRAAGTPPVIGVDERPVSPPVRARLPAARIVRDVTEIRPGLYRIDVRVRWRVAEAGSARQLELTTLYWDRGSRS